VPTDTQAIGRRGLLLAGLIGTLWLLSLVAGLTQPLAEANRLMLAVMVLIRSFVHTGLFIVAHDAMHASLIPGRPRINQAIGICFLFLYAGLSYQVCSRNHKLHHQKPETSFDPDYCRTVNTTALSWYAQFMHNYLGANQLLRLAGLWFGLYCIASRFEPNSILNIVLFCVVPLIISSLQLFIVGTWLPHRRGANTAERIAARSLSLHPTLSFAACYHFGYHREHHDSPSTPWFLLPGLRSTHLSERPGGQA